MWKEIDWHKRKRQKFKNERKSAQTESMHFREYQIKRLVGLWITEKQWPPLGKALKDRKQKVGSKKSGFKDGDWVYLREVNQRKADEQQ